MTQKITHVCQGTCSRQIDVELENGVVRSVSFTGGCHGNQQGIAALVRGMSRSAGKSAEKGFIKRPGPAGYGFCTPKSVPKCKTMYFLWYLLIGLAAGWIANLIVKGGGSGLFVNLIVGLIGGILGGWLFSLFGWVPVGTLGSLATAVIGSVILLWIAALISHRKIR